MATPDNPFTALVNAMQTDTSDPGTLNSKRQGNDKYLLRLLANRILALLQALALQYDLQAVDETDVGGEMKRVADLLAGTLTVQLDGDSAINMQPLVDKLDEVLAALGASADEETVQTLVQIRDHFSDLVAQLTAQGATQAEQGAALAAAVASISTLLTGAAAANAAQVEGLPVWTAIRDALGEPLTVTPGERPFPVEVDLSEISDLLTELLGADGTFLAALNAALGGTLKVAFDGTPNVKLTGTSKVAFDGAQLVTLDGTPTVHLDGTPNVGVDFSTLIAATLKVGVQGVVSLSAATITALTEQDAAAVGKLDLIRVLLSAPLAVTGPLTSAELRALPLQVTPLRGARIDVSGVTTAPSKKIADANANRKPFEIWNLASPTTPAATWAASTLWLNDTGPASAGQGSIPIYPGQCYYSTPGHTPTGELQIIGGSTGLAYTYKEAT